MAQITIPPEILRQIFSYLQFPDTARVSRVSRQWHLWSDEPLYAELRLIGPIFSPARLLRTLLTPGLEKLATYVRTLTVEWDFVHTEHMDDSDTVTAPDAAVASMDLFHTANSVDEQVWLLLHLLPHLDVLTLQPFSYSNKIHAFIGGMHEHTDLPLALRCVRHFSLYSDATPEVLLAIMRLPSLRALEVWDLDEIEVPFPVTLHQTAAVTDLVITDFRINILSLGHVLQLPRALTRLTLSGWFPGQNAELAHMEAALEPVRMTLQHLELHIKLYEDSTKLSFLGLSPWPVLRRLWCPIHWLLGEWTEGAELHLAHVLPPSLRELLVYGDFNWSHDLLVRELIMLVEGKEQAVPLLEKICIVREKESDVEQQLGCVCGDAGVVLSAMGGHWVV